MKLVLSIILSCGLSSLAWANPKPLLKKTMTSGFILPAHAKSLTCEMYMNKVVVTKTAGGLKTVKEISYKLTGDILQTISKAASGEIVETVAPIDAPTIEYTAHGTDIRLLAQGSRQYYNKASEARTLVNLLDQNCN